MEKTAARERDSTDTDEQRTPDTAPESANRGDGRSGESEERTTALSHAHHGVSRAATRGGGATDTHTPGGSTAGRIRYEPGPDRSALSARYGFDVQDGHGKRVQRLETEFGSDRVQRWADEGMTVETMGKPRDMQAFRERQDARPAEVPRDVERRNEASLQRSVIVAREDGPAGEGGVPEMVRKVVSSPGTSMDEAVQREMESELGERFGDVQLHTGPQAAAAAESIDARAFTVGNHVAFNRGEYRPDTDEGKQVLAHELTHVRQQTDGKPSMLPKAGSELAVDPDPALEREAERVARNVTTEGEPAGADPATHPEAAMQVQRQPAPGESATAEEADSADRGGERDGDDQERDDAGPSINTDEATSVVAEILREWGIRAPPGMSLEEEYLHSGDSSDSIFLYMTGDNTPTPPAEWVIENTPGEGIAQGAKKVLTFRILIATNDEYWVQVNQTSLESGKIEYSRGGYADRFDGTLLKEQVTGLLTQLERDGVEIGLPSEDVWMPSDDEERDIGDEGDSETGEEGDEVETTDEGDSDAEDEENESETTQEHDVESDEERGDGDSGEEVDNGEPDEETDDGDGTYTIQEGDTLWDIAEEHDVDGGWVRLWQENEEVIGENPHLIFPGEKVQIPQGPAERSYEDVEIPEHNPETVQAKLEVSSPDDPAEKEAERVAEEVMKADEPPGKSKASDESAGSHARRAVGLVRTVPVSRSATGLDVSGESEAAIRSAVSGGGKPLSGETRSFFEPRFGVDFSDVQVHTGSDADEAARSIDAKAFTMGSNIAFRSGAFQPETEEGKKLIGHELTHVVQQTDSPTASPSLYREVADPNEQGGWTLEKSGLQEALEQRRDADDRSSFDDAVDEAVDLEQILIILDFLNTIDTELDVKTEFEWNERIEVGDNRAITSDITLVMWFLPKVGFEFETFEIDFPEIGGVRPGTISWEPELTFHYVYELLGHLTDLDAEELEDEYGDVVAVSEILVAVAEELVDNADGIPFLAYDIDFEDNGDVSNHIGFDVADIVARKVDELADALSGNIDDNEFEDIFDPSLSGTVQKTLRWNSALLAFEDGGEQMDFSAILTVDLRRLLQSEETNWAQDEMDTYDDQRDFVVQIGPYIRGESEEFRDVGADTPLSEAELSSQSFSIGAKGVVQFGSLEWDLSQEYETETEGDHLWRDERTLVQMAIASAIIETFDDMRLDQVQDAWRSQDDEFMDAIVLVINDLYRNYHRQFTSEQEASYEGDYDEGFDWSRGAGDIIRSTGSGYTADIPEEGSDIEEDPDDSTSFGPFVSPSKAAERHSDDTDVFMQRAWSRAMQRGREEGVRVDAMVTLITRYQPSDK